MHYSCCVKRCAISSFATVEQGRWLVCVHDGQPLLFRDESVLAELGDHVLWARGSVSGVKDCTTFLEEHGIRSRVGGHALTYYVAAAGKAATGVRLVIQCCVQRLVHPSVAARVWELVIPLRP